MSSTSRRLPARPRTRPGARAAGALAALTLAAIGLPLAPGVQQASAAAPAAPAAATAAPVINEVESNGDDVDWVELGNPGAEPLDLSGYVFTDAEPAKKGHTYTLPEGSVVQPGGFLVLEGVQASRPGFDFGLGGEDAVRLYAPGTDAAAPDATPVVEHAWTAHAAVTYGRCPDLTGAFSDTTRSTKGAPNDCSNPLVINEIESDGGDPDDWVELYNTGAAAVDPNGLVLTDAEPDKAGHQYTLSGLEPVPAGGFLRLDTAQFGFGLGKADAVRLLSAAGQVIDEYAWTAHAATTYGRCPDGVGEFATTAQPTPGAANACGDASGPSAVAWPGGQSVATLDAADEGRGDWSGIDHEPGQSGAPGALWVVQNGDGELYRLDSTDAGASWERTRGFELRYPDGTGTVDAEGVTIAAGGSAAGLFVSTERDNDNKGVSRPAVLRFDLPAGSAGSAPVAAQPGTPTLSAAAEWNLAADFPGLGANSGLEGITWIPDSWLTEQGIWDEAAGAPYSPATYPGHGDGLFAVGVEGTGHVYLYALMDSGEFARIADIPTGLDVVADVQFDAERGQVWAVCDDACNGRIAILTPQPRQAQEPAARSAALSAGAQRTTSGIEAGANVAEGTQVLAPSALYERPAESANFGNEGFALADLSQCTNGAVPTYYVDDNNTDGHSLRTGTLSATCPEVEEPETPKPEEPSDGVDPEEPGTQEPGTEEPGEEPGAEPGDDAVDGPGTEQPVTDLPSGEGADPTVDDAESVGAAGEEDTLAATGARVLPWVLGAVGAAGFGAMLLVGARRARKA